MQQLPGCRPRGYGICIIEEVDWKSRGNYFGIVNCVISRRQLEHWKKRVEEVFWEADKEVIFRSMKYRKDFCSLLMEESVHEEDAGAFDRNGGMQQTQMNETVTKARQALRTKD